MGPHIARKWGWDEQHQYRVHLKHFGEKPFFAIERGKARIGTLSLMTDAQGKTFSTALLRMEIEIPDEEAARLGLS